MSEPIKHLVMFSSGISSWAAAKRRAEQVGTDGMVLLFADTQIEDPDNYRFLGESAANIFGWGKPPPIGSMRRVASNKLHGEISVEEPGKPGRLVILADGRDPWEVMRDEKIIGNSRYDPCSKILKRQLMDKWRNEHADRETTEIILGICWDESHRIDRVRKRTAPWNYTAPLCDKPWMSKDETLAWSVQEGVKPPSMYDLGFPHANCLHPDTRFVTRDGIFSLRETVGKNVEVVGEGGRYCRAEVKSFGEQETYEIQLRRYDDEKVLVATGDHWWPVRKALGAADHHFLSTTDLREGRRIASMFGSAKYNSPPPDAAPGAHRGILPGAADVVITREHVRGALADWRVVGVQPTGRVEEVMCAVVPLGHVFTLEHNILTHNCGGFCIKAGQASFKLLLEHFPERYAHHEEQERQMREIVGDHSVMKCRRGGKAKPLTMEAFRKRIEQDRNDHDNDLGGCACALPL